MQTPMPTVTLLDIQSQAWGQLREAVQFELVHGPSWQAAMAIQDRSRDLVRALSLPESTTLIERTAEGIRVVS